MLGSVAIYAVYIMAPGRSAAEVPVIPLGTAVASLMGFGTSLISYHTQIPSPYEWKRVKPEYVVGLVFGRFTFLTYQTIVIGTIFSLIAFAAESDIQCWTPSSGTCFRSSSP